jgi:hypothetical protein
MDRKVGDIPAYITAGGIDMLGERREFKLEGLVGKDVERFEPNFECTQRIVRDHGTFPLISFMNTLFQSGTIRKLSRESEEANIHFILRVMEFVQVSIVFVLIKPNRVSALVFRKVYGARAVFAIGETQGEIVVLFPNRGGKAKDVGFERFKSWWDIGRGGNDGRAVGCSSKGGVGPWKEEYIFIFTLVQLVDSCEKIMDIGDGRYLLV